jgi:DNA-binding NarL/FixJ family response regulator
MNSEKTYARRFIAKGVRGFLCKQTSIDELEKAVRSIFKGEVYLGEELKSTLVTNLQPNNTQNPLTVYPTGNWK